jgi:ribosomal protein L40E
MIQSHEEDIRTCRKCGRTLPVTEFPWHRHTCRSCDLRYKHEEYMRNRAVPDRVYPHPRTGQLIEHRLGIGGTRIYWSPSMLQHLCRHFATTPNADLAIDLGVSLRTVIRKARELGLSKSPRWLAGVNGEHCRVMHAINKIHGNSGQWRPGMHPSPATEFKPGQPGRRRS